MCFASGAAPNNNHYPLTSVRVCRDDLDPDVCRLALDIDIAAGYTGGSGGGGGVDFNDDWAIIEIKGSWPQSTEVMTLSSASDTVLGALTNVHNIGFPYWAPYCTQIIEPGTMFHNNEIEPIAGIGNKSMRLKIDGTPRQSGSPVYFCPAGDDNVCASGDPAHVIWVWAGWNTVNNRFVGPKVSFHRANMLAFIND